MSIPAARALLASLVVGVAALMAGCSGSSRHAGTTTTTSARSFQVSTPGGQVTLSLDGRLPPNWPQGFPVPEGASPAGSGSLSNGASGTRVGVYSTSASGQDTFSYYTGHSGLSTSGTRSAGLGSSYVGNADIDSPYDGSVTVVSHSGRTYIVVVLTGSSSTTASTT